MGQDRPECPTKLLVDEVAAEDAFRHDEVAHAIAEMMLGEPGGCAVALTGAWGSGKSTVVQRLMSDLEQKDPNFQAFIFDAWAHQGDPLRRTFLEKLIGWCGGERNWTKDKARWRNAVQELARRREITKTTSSPSVTKWGIAAAVSVLLAPLALQVYLKTEYQYHPIWDGVGFGFSLGPLLVGTALLFYWCISEVGKRPDERKTLPNILVTSAENVTTTETSRTPDPTSVEFEKRYRELLTEVLAGDEASRRRRILIVIDNLDRINHRDAKSIWATLRVFFDHAIGDGVAWHDRVWVLVPFDPEAIDDLWEAPVLPDGTDEITSLSGPREMSKHFLEKTFQATFRVPPILLSNWESFLLRQLRMAFPHPRHSDTELYTIFRLYDRLKPPDESSPTPRNLKIFVNSVGSSHRQWQDRIPLPDQAAFVLLSQRGMDIPGLLLGSDSRELHPTMTHTLSGLLDEGWRLNIAALHFNVEPDVAGEILLPTPVQEALLSGDCNKLVPLENVPGFSEILESAIESPFVNSKPTATSVARAALVVSSLRRQSGAYERCKAHLLRFAGAFEDWEPFNAEVAQGIAAIVRMAPDGTDFSPIVRNIRNSLRPKPAGTPQGSAAAPNAKDWCAGVAIVLPELVRRDEAAVKNGFAVQASAEGFFTVINEANANGHFGSIWRYLSPTANKDAIWALLLKRVNEGGWDSQSVTTLTNLRAVTHDWDWSALASAFRARLEAARQAPQADSSPVLTSLFSMSPFSPDVHQSLRTVEQSEIILQTLHNSASESDWSAAGLCVLILLSGDAQIQPQGPNYPPNTAAWRMQRGREFIWGLVQNPGSAEHVLAVVVAKSTLWLPYASWREIAEKRSDRRPLIVHLLRRRLEAGDAARLAADELIGNLAFWREVFGSEAAEAVLLGKANAGELSAALAQRPFSISDQHLHLLALSNSNDERHRGLLASALGELAAQDWLGVLLAEGEMIDVVLDLGKRGLVLRQAFQDGLALHVEKKFSEPATGDRAEFWPELLDLLDITDRKVFDRRLLNAFKSSRGRVLGAIPYYGSELLEVVGKDGPENSYDRLKQMVEGHDATELEWLSRLFGGWPAASSDAIRADLAKRAREGIREDVPEAEKSALANLLKVLGPRTAEINP